MKRKIKILFIILILIILLSFTILKLITKNISPIMMEYSKSKVKRLASLVINKGITDDVLNKINTQELFIVDKSNNEEIITITLDPLMVNRIESSATDKVESILSLIEKNDQELLAKYNINSEYFVIPSGIVFNNGLMANVGPLIPIKMKLIGNVTSKVTTSLKEYGINNSLITVSVNITVELKVILPLTIDSVSITNSVPVAIKLIQGKVPNYYGSSLYVDKEKEST